MATTLPHSLGSEGSPRPTQHVADMNIRACGRQFDQYWTATGRRRDGGTVERRNNYRFIMFNVPKFSIPDPPRKTRNICLKNQE